MRSLTMSLVHGNFKLKLNINIAARLAMKTISMLDFRQNADKIIAQVQKGQRMILTCRGKPVARLEPIIKEAANGDDPFYSLSELSGATDGGVGESLTNAQIDGILYGQ